MSEEMQWRSLTRVLVTRAVPALIEKSAARLCSASLPTLGGMEDKPPSLRSLQRLVRGRLLQQAKIRPS